MRLDIKATNIHLSDRVRFLIEEKISKPVFELAGRIDERMDIILDIEVGKTTRHHNKGRIWFAEANLDLPRLKKVLRANALTESLEASLDEAKDRLFIELKKYKEKRKDKSIRKFRHPRKS